MPGVPAKVSGLSVTAGAGKLDLSWTAPAANGSAITGYDVHYKTSAAADQTGTGSDPSTGWVAASHSTTSPSGSIPSLTAGTAYDVRVRAKNANGAGQWSDAGSATPAAPTWRLGPSDRYTVEEGVSALPRIQLSEPAPTGGLTWTLTLLFGNDVPSDRCENYSAATSRAVAADVGANPPTTLTVSAGSTSGEARFPLAADTLYDERDECFAVRFTPAQAVIDAGWILGTIADPDAVPDVAQIIIFNVVPAAPGAVTDLSVTPGNAKLDLTWTAPSGTVTGYDVHYTSASDSGQSAVGDDDAASGSNPATAWVAVSRTETDPPTASQSITGLTNDTAYRVRVRARNAGGEGSWVRDTGTPAAPTAPGAPTGLEVSANDGQLIIRWTAPTSGGAVAAYDFHYTSASEDDVGNNAAASGSDPSAAWVVATRGTNAFAAQVLLGLTNGREYRLRVRAKNGGGASGWLHGTGTPAAQVPVQPTNLRVTAGDGRLDIAWHQPNASTVTGYDVHYTSAPATGSGAVGDDADASGADPSAAWVDAGHTGTTASHAITGLDNGTAYRVRVRGVNASGNGPWARRTGTPMTADMMPAPRPVPTGGLTLWSATLTVQDVTIFNGQVLKRGCENGSGKACTTNLTDTTFRFNGAEYGITEVSLAGGDLIFQLNKTLAGAKRRLVLAVDGTRFAGRTATFEPGTTPANSVLRWGSSGLTWSAGGTVSLSLVEIPTAHLVVSPNPVPEGTAVSVEACLQRGLAYAQGDRTWQSHVPRGPGGGVGDVAIPLIVTAGTAEVQEDYGGWVFRDGMQRPVIHITGAHQRTCGVINIPTFRDADTDDETFTVMLDMNRLPSSLVEGGTTSTEVTIKDLDGWPAVSLEAVQNPVAEGSPVQLKAVLTKPLGHDVTIPLVVKPRTAEREDYGGILSITIPSGSTSGEGQIATYRDDDHDDETFTVWVRTPRLIDLGVQEGSPAYVRMTIEDDAGAQDAQPAADASTAGDLGAVAAPGSYAALIAQMREWRNDPQWAHLKEHTDRWDRALLAFGKTVADATLTPMTAAEAQGFADRGWTRWVEVAKALRQIEGGGTQTPADPVVTITAGKEAVTESALVVFTVTAAPAPVSDLDVTVTVGQEGAFVYDWALGTYTVTIPAGGTSVPFEVLTVDDAEDEPDGAVVVTLTSGADYALGAAKRARVAVADDDEPPPAVVTKRALAREGSDDAVRFAVRLEPAAPHTVTVDYATADGAGRWMRLAPARAGADYTATSGTLTFAPGQAWQFVEVPILDDAVDEGTEYFLLRFSNPQGATLAADERETQGLIRNDDHLQAMWLARFGRTVGSQVTDAVSERLQGGLSPGAHATLAGQRVDFSKADDGKALAEVMTGLAQTFGAPSGPAANDDPGSGAGSHHGLADSWNDPVTATAARSITGRELLLGSAFHVAGTGDGAGPGLAAWGRVAQAGFDGEHADGTGRTNVDGTVLTGVLGADADFGRLLAGVAVSLSDGDGSFDNAGADVGGKGSIESRMTVVSPYARYRLSERVTAWGLAGWGTGDMTIRFDDGSMAPVRTDLSMQLGALGARGALLEQDDAGGMDLALKADAFFVTTESEQAANSVETQADASRLRLVLEGGRAFVVGNGATFRPSLELGVRHDGGDAETGTGVELGGGLAFTDADSGLSIEARARMLLAHADSDYREWGASATARLDPGERGRGLSFSLSPTIGASSSAAERLWGAHDARALAPGGEFEAARGLTVEAGYGLSLGGDRFTGTPNLGFGMSDGGTRDWRIGWRLTSVVRGDPGFEVSLDATRREAANDNAAEHGVMLRSLIKW